MKYNNFVSFNYKKNILSFISLGRKTWENKKNGGIEKSQSSNILQKQY